MAKALRVNTLDKVLACRHGQPAGTWAHPPGDTEEQGRVEADRAAKPLRVMILKDVQRHGSHLRAMSKPWCNPAHACTTC